MNLDTVPAILVDATNIDHYLPILIASVKATPVVGFDIETYDEAHDGIVSYRNAKRLVFDVKRTTVAGFSIYSEGDDNSYYINLNHADVENRIPWEQGKEILDAIPSETIIVCHNAPFELTMMGESLNYEFSDNIVCTLQMCVSAYGPDEYPQDKWTSGQLGGLKVLHKDIAKHFATWKMGDNMTPDQHELLIKVIAKESDAAHCYNGFCKSIAYGYGLKQAVKSWFNFDMANFADTLGDKANMGELTGAETADYGADDAYWCVKLFYKLLEFMGEHCPNAISTFMTQENPMVHVYSKLWREGLLVNQPAILSQQDVERATYAQDLRELKLACKTLLPFPDDPHKDLMKYDKWYAKKPQELRERFIQWIESPNVEDDKEQCAQVSCAVTNAWLGIESKLNKNLSIQHYFQVRLLMYDLMRMKSYVAKGKTQSDGDSRGNMLQRITRCRTDEPYLAKHKPDGITDTDTWLNNCEKAITAFNSLAGTDQRCKLYITPYLQLTDPDTNRMYPVLSSKLASRRMAMAYPNGMQLAKRGQSTYVRGFYEPDEKDEVLIAIDWSQVELVEIGDFSGDPEFAKAYGQTPYQDLHLGAACDVLQVVWPELTLDMLTHCDTMDDQDIIQGLMFDSNGNKIPKGKRRSYWRTEVGKGSNFNYWYSGALNTVGERLGWTSDQMWEATDRYRTRFAVAEKWRVDLIEQAKWSGFIELPDGHRRYRQEVTHAWATQMKNLTDCWDNQAISNFYNLVTRKIASRAGNQLVNSMIQGSCATLAKQSILNINREIDTQGFKARFKMPIHDELVFSVNRHEVVPFLTMAKDKMCDHPNIIKTLKLQSTASMGLTFEPYHKNKAPVGQIELNEAPDICGFTPDSALNDNQIQEAVDYLYKTVKR